MHGGTITSGRAATCCVAGAVLDELDQLVLEHHLAGRDAEVAADLERGSRRSG